MKDAFKNSHSGKTPFPLFRSAKYFLLILTPLLVLLALTMWQFYLVERDNIFIETKTLDTQRLEAEQKIIIREFQIVVADLLSLAEQNEIMKFIDDNDRPVLGEAAREYYLLSKNRGTYDQIRFIDDTGQELIRVNFNYGSPEVVAPEKLQNKKSRYYFQETIKLPKGHIFTSPLDLNIEYGRIEHPMKPMIRLGAPVFNSKNQKKGIVLINYLASQLLNKMTIEFHETHSEFMLINNDGHWLHSPNEGEAWGFMYHNGQDRVFANSFPEAWEYMVDKDAGSIHTANGLFTFKRINPIKFSSDSPAVGPATNHFPWIAISHVTPARLQELTRQTNIHFIKLFALLTQGALLSALLITWALVKRKTAEQIAASARAQKDEFMLWRTTQDSAVAELSSHLLSEMSLKEITESIVNKSKFLTNSRFAFAGYIDKDNGNLVCPSISDDIMTGCTMDDKEMIFSKCAGLWGWVIKNRQAMFANDPPSDPRSTGLPPGHIPISRFLSVPAMINDELVGIVALANSDIDYTEKDIMAIGRIATLFALAIQRKRTDESIHRLLMGTAAVTGKQFFNTMVEQLAKCLGTKYIMVGEILPDKPSAISGLAFWNGDALGEPFNYKLTGTPCEQVNKNGFCLYRDDVANQFPTDKDLCAMNIKFYAGIPLRDTNGAPIGILCALHDAPIDEIPHIHEIFQIFSNRASGEIERQRVERDLAQAKEAAEIANKAKSRFLANMSHELRTPLNAIIGFATVLQEQHFGPMSPQQLRYTNDIKDGGNHLLSTINNILDLAKIEAGKMPFNTMPADIIHLIKQCLESIKKSAEQAEIEISLAIGPEVSELILDIDELKIRQVLLNLLSNAIKFTPEKGRVNVAVNRDNDTLLININDTGIGIAADDMPRIFEPFYQIKNEYRGKTPGTGLGLSLTKTLVEMHSGTLKVLSEGINHGASFIISLPIKESKLATALMPKT